MSDCEWQRVDSPADELLSARFARQSAFVHHLLSQPQAKKMPRQAPTRVDSHQLQPEHELLHYPLTQNHYLRTLTLNFFFAVRNIPQHYKINSQGVMFVIVLCRRVPMN